MLSRRSLLTSIGVALSRPLLYGLQDPAQYGLQALLNKNGFIRIEPGEFSMGSRNGAEDERPVHQVRISRAFEIGKYEVTQSQWETVMRDPHAKAATPTATRPEQETINATPSYFKGEALPVESVSWDDIQKFLERLNARSDAYRFRLPTEAEWEYASARGSGDNSPATLAAVAWYKDNSDGATKPIGQKEPNRQGLYDTIGNVAEWVQDWYGANYYSGSAHVDPQGPASGSYRVFRGGSWLNETKFCGASIRAFDFPGSRFYNVGFRLVRMESKPA